MKHRSKFRNGGNTYEVYFTYEDYYGGTKFRSYDEMQEKSEELPNIENSNGTLVGWIHSFYWGTTERISSLDLHGKPTISEVKAFMRECYKELDYDGKPDRYKLVKNWYLADTFEVNDEGEEVLGIYDTIEEARAAMDADVAEVEAANCYQWDEYGGEDDCQTSERISANHHYYDMADSNGSFVEWEIEKNY